MSLGNLMNKYLNNFNIYFKFTFFLFLMCISLKLILGTLISNNYATIM